MISFVRHSRCLLGQNALRTVCATYCTHTGSKEHIEGLVKNNKVVVFMKGTPEQPRCGFSNAVVQILKFHGVNAYDAHDVLQDDDLRQGMHRLVNPMTYTRPNKLLLVTCVFDIA